MYAYLYCIIIISYDSISPTRLCDICGESLGKEKRRKQGRKEGGRGKGREEEGKKVREERGGRVGDKEAVSGKLHFCF